MKSFLNNKRLELIRKVSVEHNSLNPADWMKKFWIENWTIVINHKSPQVLPFYFRSALFNLNALWLLIQLFKNFSIYCKKSELFVLLWWWMERTSLFVVSTIIFILFRPFSWPGKNESIFYVPCNGEVKLNWLKRTTKLPKVDWKIEKYEVKLQRWWKVFEKITVKSRILQIYRKSLSKDVVLW